LVLENRGIKPLIKIKIKKTQESLTTMVMEDDAILDPFWIANQSHQGYLDTNDCKKTQTLQKKRTQERHELNQKCKKI